MRILHIIPGYGGGISSFVKNLASGSTDGAIVNDVIGFTGYPDDFSKVIKDQNGHYYTMYSFHRNPLRALQQYSEVLRSNKYDILHCHISGYKGLIFKVVAHRLGIERIIVHAHRTSDEKINWVHGLSVWGSRMITKFLATDFVACSRMAGDFIFGGDIVKGESVLLLPNSIDLVTWTRQIEEKRKQELRIELNIPEESLVLGHVGRFNLQKNHCFIIDILAELKEQGVQFICLFGGDGELREGVQALVSQKELEEHVRFLGFRKDIEDIMKLFDIMLLPSLYEGLPTVAIEAQAAGIRCILSDTITKEADMGFKIVDYCSINDIDEWVNRVKVTDLKQMSPEYRLEQMESNGFSISGMQKKYLEAIMK